MIPDMTSIFEELNEEMKEMYPSHPIWSYMKNEEACIAVPPDHGLIAFGDPDGPTPGNTGARPKSVSRSSSNASTWSYKYREVENPVLLEEPWRDVKWGWDEKVYEEKRRAIIDTKPIPTEPEVPAYNVLLCGMIGSGKSSLVNTFSSALRGEHCQLAHNAEDQKSVTTQYRMYRLRPMSGGQLEKAIPVNLFDTMGYEDQNTQLVGPTVRDMEYIMKGHVMDGYRFKPNCSIDSSDPKFHKFPQLKDKMHVVVLVIDGQAINYMSPSVKIKLGHIVGLAKDNDVRVACVVTKVDKVCGLVDKDIREVFHSEQVHDAVEQVFNRIGIVKSNIFPMQNYVTLDPDPSINILSLDTLQHIVRLASNTLESQALYLNALPADRVVPPTIPLRDSPWRKDEDLLPENIADHVASLYEDLMHMDTPRHHTINIAVLGPSGAGKSDFINSAMSEMYEKIVKPAATGYDDLTTRYYKEYRLRQGRDGVKTQIVLCDTMGTTSAVSIRPKDLLKILDGVIPDNTPFNPDNDFTSAIFRREKKPIHAVAICIDGRSYACIPESIMKTTLEQIRAVKDNNVGLVVLVTHLDEVCSHVHQDASKVYRSEEVNRCLDAIFETLQAAHVAMVDILPVVNYSSRDVNLVMGKSALILNALDHLVTRAKDYMAAEAR